MTDKPSVLIVDNDRDIADLVRALLTDEGYEVSVVHDTAPDALAAALGRLEPDCVLLDGESGAGAGYGTSWAAAARTTARGRPVPVIMFTAHRAALDEARSGRSDRAKDAGFAAVVAKPFDIDVMLDAVRSAVDGGKPFDRSEQADTRRTDELVRRLEDAGARDIRRSERREWVTFRDASDDLMQLYWWQTGGCYYVGRYPGAGSRLETLGLFYDVDAAVASAAGMLGRGAPEGAAD